MRMREDEGEVVERKAGGAVQGADDGVLLLTRLPGRLVRPRRAVLAIGGTTSTPGADGFGGDAIAACQDAGTLLRSSDLGADSGRGVTVRVDGEHQQALREE